MKLRMLLAELDLLKAAPFLELLELRRRPFLLGFLNSWWTNLPPESYLMEIGVFLDWYIWGD